MLSDIEIAQAAKLKRIDDLAHEGGSRTPSSSPTAATKPK